ncbi:MAG TPA: single-stranded DNA-binding protein [bacterium]|nr:single-stranded DNA-binding protein [bacterium]
MLNFCILTGNIGGDPEINYSHDGNPIASFNLAFRSGKEKTGWIKITAFSRIAEITEKYLHKGARIAVVGSLDQEKWQTESGENRTGYKIIAHSIEFIKTDGRGFENNQSDQPDNDDVPF